MKLLYTLLLISTFISCKSLQKEHVVGIYEARDKAGGYHKLEFSDSTYDYNNYWELAHWESKGSWIVRGKKIIINSNKDHITGYMESVEEKKTDSIGYIQALDDGGPTVFEVKVNGKWIVTDVHYDKISIGNTPVKNFEISSIELKEALSYTVKDTSANTFIVKIIPYDPWKSVYKDGKIKVYRDGIKFKGLKFKKTTKPLMP